MVESTRPLQRADIETHIMPDGTCLLFDAVSNQGRALNAAGALVWDYCDGTLSAGEIAAELAELLPDDPELYARTFSLLDELEQMGFVIADDHASPLSPESDTSETE